MYGLIAIRDARQKALYQCMGYKEVIAKLRIAKTGSFPLSVLLFPLFVKRQRYFLVHVALIVFILILPHGKFRVEGTVVTVNM
jgi:hypothetical protein